MMNVSPAVYSGVCASLASLFGKLSGLEFDFLDVTLRFITKALLFSTMVFLNSLVWTFFVKALHNSKTTVEATAVSTATNYVLSGILGFIFFNEVTGILWWFGISLVVLGVIIVTHSSTDESKNLKSLPKEGSKTPSKRVTRKTALRDQ